MSEMEHVVTELSNLREEIMRQTALLAALKVNTHSPANCTLNERLSTVEKQQNQWAGGLAILIPLVSLLSVLASTMLGKFWK